MKTRRSRTKFQLFLPESAQLSRPFLFDWDLPQRVRGNPSQKPTMDPLPWMENFGNTHVPESRSPVLLFFSPTTVSFHSFKTSRTQTDLATKVGFVVVTFAK